MIWKTAWKNVWRNKVRSLVVISSVAVGIFAGAFSVSVFEGMVNQRLNAALNEETGYIQVNSRKFRDNQDINLLLNNPDSLEDIIAEVPGVVATAKRLIVQGMAGSAARNSNVQIIGVDTEKEKDVLILNERLIEGTGNYFESDSRYMPAYIGEDLAKELNIVRFIVDTVSLEKMRSAGVPEQILEKLDAFRDIRYTNEKKFRKDVRAGLTTRESSRYLVKILQSAWSFREGSRISLTFIDMHNNQVSALFRICGLYGIKNGMFESTNVFVRDEDLRSLAALGNGTAHMVVVKLEDNDFTGPATLDIRRLLPGLEVLNWKQIHPDVGMMKELMVVFYIFFMAIILAALAFGIVNTMLMVVLERTKELGMLKAIGMNKKKIFNMIMLESVFLTLTGGVAGVIISKVVISLTAANGINFANYSDAIEALGFSAHLYPEISPGFLVLVIVLIIVTGLLSAIYPAYRALKLDPSEALRTE